MVKNAFISLLFLASIIPGKAAANWTGPFEIIKINWGTAVGEVGYLKGDSEDDVPGLSAVTKEGRVVISDTVNKKQLVFASSGLLTKEVKWVVKSTAGGRTSYSIPEFFFGTVVGYDANGNLYSSGVQKYFLRSSDGQLLATYNDFPPELGEIEERSMGNNKYQITINYPDKNYTITSDRIFSDYMRDMQGFIYGVNAGGVWRFSICGKLQGSVLNLSAQKEKIYHSGSGEPDVYTQEDYGKPLVSPNGDVYIWKRTPDKYSILKWTWVDDPNVPTGPDAPTGLSVAASINGLYLTWTASPNDPGCVTGYVKWTPLSRQ